MSNAFGTLLWQERRKAKKNLIHVANAIGCTTSFVSDVENGRRKPFDKIQIEAVARLLEIDPMPMIAAAARERNAVTITSSRDDVWELAAGLARVLEEGDDAILARLHEVMEEANGKRRGG